MANLFSRIQMMRKTAPAIPRALYTSVQMNFRFCFVLIIWITSVRLRRPWDDVCRSMISWMNELSWVMVVIHRPCYKCRIVQLERSAMDTQWWALSHTFLLWQGIVCVSHEVGPHWGSPQKGISSEQLEWHVEPSKCSNLTYTQVSEE